MSSSNPGNKVAFVIASCDKYSDLWPALFGQIFKYWPDIPYQIYLIANHKRYDNPRVTTLLAGNDLDWSSTVLKSINQLQEKYVLLWVDDAFLRSKVDTGRISSLVHWFIVGSHNFLRIRPNPKPKKWSPNGIGILLPEQAYRVSLFATLWNVDLLKVILLQGESAWQFEVNGSERSKNYDHFYCTRDEVFNYWHGVERGVWIRTTAKALERCGYHLDYQRRRCMSRGENIGLTYRLFKSWILHKIPERRRADALRFIRACYCRLGMRKP
jgi:hypothetical protein